MISEARLSGWENEAETLYRQAIANGSIIASWNLHNVLMMTDSRRYDEIVDLLIPLENAYGHWYGYWEHLAWAHVELGQLDTAIEVLQRGIERAEDGEQYFLHAELAEYYPKYPDSRHLRDALAAWDIAFAASREDPRALSYLLEGLKSLPEASRGGRTEELRLRCLEAKGTDAMLDQDLRAFLTSEALRATLDRLGAASCGWWGLPVPWR